jgi:proteasome inhibitor subunit 1 (PI31)
LIRLPQDNKSTTLDLLLSDYFSASAFPFHLDRPLLDCYINNSRLNDLISLYRLNILQKLIPALRKEGYTELTSTTASNTSAGTTSQQQSTNLGRPEGPYYPDRGGPMGIPMPIGGGGAVPAYFNPPTGDGSIPAPPPGFNEINNPFNIGRSDLDPLGGGNFQGFPGSQGPAFGGLPGSNNGGGMMVGPNHPMFRDRFGADPMGGDDMRSGIGGLGEGMRNGRGNNGNTGIYPGPHPPGARYDPIGPGVSFYFILLLY